MRTLLHSIGSVLVGFMLIVAETSLAGPAQPPNVVLFLSDDLGYGDLVLGAISWVMTLPTLHDNKGVV